MREMGSTGNTDRFDSERVIVKVRVHRLRALTEHEGNRLAQAFNLMVREEGANFHGVPVLRTALAALVVFVDEGCETAYTDCHYRVGLSPELLDEGKTPLATLAFTLMHETMHNTQRHNDRLDEKGYSPDLSNMAADLEINAMIAEGCMGIDLGSPISSQIDKWRLTPYALADGTPGIPFPTIGDFRDYPRCGTAEQYAMLLKNDPIMERCCRRSIRITVAAVPNGGWIGPMEDLDDETQRARFAEADRLGFHPLTPAEEARIREQVLHDLENLLMDRRYGDQAMRQLLQLMADGLKPPVIDWKIILARMVATSMQAVTRGRAEYSYRLPNIRRTAISNAIFPGLVKYDPKLMIALDTSASMHQNEYMDALAEIEGVCRTVADPSFFCIDVEAKGAPRLFHSARELLSQLQGGGGTDMAAAVDAATAMPPQSRPDVLVIATDGDFDWNALHDSLAKREARRMAVIIVIVKRHFDSQKSLLAKEDRLRCVHPHTTIIQTQFT